MQDNLLSGSNRNVVLKKGAKDTKNRVQLKENGNKKDT